MPTFLVGFCLVALALAVCPFLRQQRHARLAHIVDAVDAELAAGQIDRAVRLTDDAVRQAREAGICIGLATFAHGIALERKAVTMPADSAMSNFALAARAISGALDAGLPAEHQARAHFLLGKCLVHARDFTRATPLLESSVRDYRRGRVEAMDLLALSYNLASSRDAEASLRTYERLLREPEVTGDRLARAWAARRDLRIELDRTDSLANLEAISASPANTWLAPMLDAEACREADQAAEAEAIYAQVADASDNPLAVRRRAALLRGFAIEAADEPKRAVEALQAVSWGYPGTIESAAAWAAAGRLYGRLGDARAAADSLERAAQELSAAGNAVHPILTRDALCQLIEASIRDALSANQSDAAIVLLDGHRLVAPVATAEWLAAETLSTCARLAVTRCANNAGLADHKSRDDATRLLNQATELWLKLGRVESDSDASQSIWRAAELVALGGDLTRAAELADELLAREIANELRPTVLAGAAEWNRLLGRLVRAAALARECIEQYPSTPPAARARLQWALVLAANGDTTAAESHLRSIFAPASGETDPELARSARLALGRLLREAGREAEALAEFTGLLSGELEPAVELEVRYLRADCLRRAARADGARADEARSDEARVHYERRRDVNLQRALDEFVMLQRELAAVDRQGRASSAERQVLADVRWAIAECLYELRRYEDAAAIYEKLAEAAPEPAAWLQAQVQIANCYWRLDRPDDSRRVLRAARQRVDRLPTPARDQMRLGMSPGHWQQWLDWTSRLQ